MAEALAGCTYTLPVLGCQPRSVKPIQPPVEVTCVLCALCPHTVHTFPAMPHRPGSLLPLPVVGCVPRKKMRVMTRRDDGTERQAAG